MLLLLGPSKDIEQGTIAMMSQVLETIALVREISNQEVRLDEAQEMRKTDTTHLAQEPIMTMPSQSKRDLSTQ